MSSSIQFSDKPEFVRLVVTNEANRALFAYAEAVRLAVFCCGVDFKPAFSDFHTHISVSEDYIHDFLDLVEYLEMLSHFAFEENLDVINKWSSTKERAKGELSTKLKRLSFESVAEFHSRRCEDKLK